MSQTLEQLILAFEVQGADAAQSAVNKNTAAMKNAKTEAKGLADSVGKVNFKPLSFISALTGSSSLSSVVSSAANAAHLGGFASGAAGGAGSALGVGALAILPVIGLLRLFVGEFKRAVEHLLDYVKQVQNIKDLTGGTAQESARLALTFQVAGVAPNTGLREILRIGQANQSPRGSRALQQLGINPGSQLSSIKEIDRVLDALSRMQNGIRKTQLAMDIFGARGALALQPILRMTQFQREQIRLLGDTFNENALGAVQSFMTSLNLLGATIEQRLVLPFVTQVLPVLTTTIDLVTRLVNWFANLNDSSGGLLAMAVAFGLIGAALGLVIGKVWAFVAALNGAIIKQAILDALSGNYAALAAGAAVGLAVGGGIYAFNKLNEDKSGSKVEDNTKRAADSLDAIKQMIGGGNRARRVKSDIEWEGQLARALAPGGGLI